MLEQLTYRNHLGEELSFGKGGIFVNESDLHDFSWNYTSKNNRISAFKKGIVKKSLDVIIACTSEEEGIAKRNALYEICEKDVLANKHGKIFIGDFYFRCFITGSKKSDYLAKKQQMTAKLTIVSDLPSWIRENKYAFRKSSSPLAPGTGGQDLDFNFDFPFDYTAAIMNYRLPNDELASSDFSMIVYGPCNNPLIYISEHIYNVGVTLLSGEYLVIDSVEKTIILVRNNGEKVNCFNSRNRDSYVFEKIKPGENVVVWDGSFGFDITVLEERSEPKWT